MDRGPKRTSNVATDLREGLVRTSDSHTASSTTKCAVDDVWSGLRFVYRLKDRPAQRPDAQGAPVNSRRRQRDRRLVFPAREAHSRAGQRDQSERGPVVGQHRRREPVVAAALGELAEPGGEAFAQATMLPVVLDGHGNLCLIALRTPYCATATISSPSSATNAPPVVIDIGESQRRTRRPTDR